MGRGVVSGETEAGGSGWAMVWAPGWARLSVHPTVCLPTRSSFCLSIPPSICPFNFLPVYPPPHTALCPPLQPFVHPSIHSSVHPSVRPSVCPSIRPSIRPPSCPPIPLSIRPSTFPPTHPSAHPFTHCQPIHPPNVHPHVHLSLCPSTPLPPPPISLLMSVPPLSICPSTSPPSCLSVCPSVDTTLLPFGDCHHVTPTLRPPNPRVLWVIQSLGKARDPWGE